MGVIYYKGVAYGGGSNVEANPSETATGTLTKVGIDGTVYEVSGGIPTSEKGAANGVAELDSNGKVPSSQLPSFVDDVVEAYYDSNTDRFYEESTFTTVIPPVDGKCWVDVLANKSYRWTGSVYVRVDEGVQLGTTHSTAAYGDDAVSTAEPTFTEASTRTNLLGSGEKLSVIFGKIKKYFSDLKDLAFIAKDGTSSTKYLRGDGTWQAFPTIPTVNDGTLTIKQNGTSKGTFTANQSTGSTVELTDTTYSEASTSAAGLMSATDKTKLNGVATGAEVNQNAFSNVLVGSTTVAADSKADTLELVAGSNVTLTPDATNDKVTIAATDTTYSDATTSASGLMSAADKTKLNGIPTVQDKTITIKLNGTTIGDFTLNQSSDETIDIQVTKSDVGLSDVGNFKAVSTVANQGLSSTEQTNARANIGAGTSNFDGAYSSLSGTPTLGDLASKNIDGVSSTKFLKGDGTWDNVPSGGVSGVKGDAESTYRTGNVNITPANVGALALSGGTMTGDIELKQSKKIIPESGYNCTLGSTSKPFSSVSSAIYNFCNYFGTGYGMLSCLQLSADRSWYLPDETGTLLTQEGSNLVTIHYHSGTQETGSTGNIATGYTADGKTFLCGAYVTNVACCMRMWVSNSNSKWYLTAINPNTGATLNKVSVSYKYFAVILNSAS